MDSVRGFFPDEVKSIGELVKRMKYLGFQATEVYKAADMLHRMLEDNVTRFLGFTSNIISSGLRETVAYMVKEGWFDAVVTTVGGIEEDIMKSLGAFTLGEWSMDDEALRKEGMNRIGNIFVPDSLYEELERFLHPVFEEVLSIQKERGRMLAPSEIFKIIGEKMNDERSFLYWAAKKDVPVFCPAPTDGAFGLQLFYFKEDGHRELGIDVTGDDRVLASLVFDAEKTGAFVIGGGVPKHHIIGANLARGGLDYAVYISTAVEWDGSLSGARPREGKSWNKIKGGADTVHVFAEATTVVPLIVGAVVEWRGNT